MPEGDSIFKAATRLRAALDGKPVTRLAVPVHGPRAPARDIAAPGRVTAVESHGKHLWIRFDDGRALRIHLGMHGRVDVYAPGERWRRATSSARAIVEVPGAVAVCFGAPTAEIVDARLARPAHLGPDLLDEHPDIDESLKRMAALDPATPIGVALLDQRIAAGIGNVYKSEVLYACHVDPFAPLSELEPATRRALLETAAAMLAANIGPGRRTTVPGGYAVYRRTGRACRRCRTPIRSQRQGEHARTTYWCPSCQAPGRASGASES